ncbi:hypothetical protein SAMN06269185_2876 [Natronoarchaeum philippinense]|uniref:PH domain-containing protein n=1 Tax=Natronoarchaeum philippinense TaxID=558529 RepID=A0A285P6J2_NATPI|nr:hypothetical protein [Natronoarchaeum philippinense]SNZ17068.1 hypothetical protein SAMN06269185_2876 [Natronoarchaeum philippinense]
MGAFELLSRLVRRPLDRSESASIPEATVRTAERARGETVTPAVLANATGRSDRAITEYLADDEQPEYVFQGNRLLISDGEDTETKYPTRDTQVVVTDRRVLIVFGGQLSDELWETPLEDVQYAYLDDESWKRHLIVEANRDDSPMTFYVDVTLESNVDEVRAGAEYVRERSE